MITKNITLIRNAQPYDFGGGERFPVLLAKVLKDKNLNPIVISRSSKLIAFANDSSLRTVKGWWWKKQNWSGASILLTPVYLSWQILLYFYYLILFTTYKVDVAHIQSKDDFIAGTLAARTLGIRVVWTDHADLKHIWQNITVWYKNPIGKIIYAIAKLTNTITVVSNSELNLVSDNLPENSVIRTKMKVVYNGAFDTRGQYQKQASDTLVISFAGRLVHDKGVGELIDAFISINKKYPNTKLEILGHGPDAAHFKAMSNSNTSIKFHGHQNNPLAHLSQSDIFIHPTYHEGFSLSLVEASMLGLPIIATDVGGNPEIIIDHETGLLVPVKDSVEIAKKIEELITNPELRNTLGSNARAQYLKKFQFDSIVKEEFIPLYGVTL